ncbi:hypothetical protein GCM10009730_08630 [Streptomyces albidochromogenes]
MWISSDQIRPKHHTPRTTKAAPNAVASAKEVTGLVPCATGARRRARAPVHHSRAAPNTENAVPAKTAGPLSIPVPLTLAPDRPDLPDGEAGTTGTPPGDADANRR